MADWRGLDEVGVYSLSTVGFNEAAIREYIKNQERLQKGQEVDYEQSELRFD